MQRIIELQIPSYGLLTVIGIIVAVFFVYCRNEHFGISTKQLTVFTAIVLIGMAVGSRVVFVLSQIPLASRTKSWLWLWHSITNGGFVFYGGLFGAISAVFLISRIKKKPARHLLNYYVPAFPVFHIFGRIGCFFAGCCYGIPSSFGIVLPEVDAQPRLPVQLFESAYNLLIVTILLIYEYRCQKREKPYNLLTLYLFLYAPYRFIIEFFRGDVLRGTFGLLSTSQWISLISLLAIAIIFVCKKVKCSELH